MRSFHFNVVLGTLVAWVLVRYRFPGKRVIDPTVELPFALPTAVAGIALATLYAPNDRIGALLAPLASRSPTRRWASSWRWSSSTCPSWCAPCSR